MSVARPRNARKPTTSVTKVTNTEDDTAGSARDVGRRQRPTEDAIADAGCAARYGLVVLDQDIADQPDNTTRFVIVSRPGQSLPLQLDQ